MAKLKSAAFLHLGITIATGQNVIATGIQLSDNLPKTIKHPTSCEARFLIFCELNTLA
jgi:hypothetical protein